MPLIKVRTRGKHFVRFITRFDFVTHETLHAYCHWVGEPPEYVLGQLVDELGAKDKQFRTWRAAHPESHVPRRVVRRPRVTRRPPPHTANPAVARPPDHGPA